MTTAARVHEREVAELLRNIERLSDAYSKLGNGQDIRDLIEFIRVHQKGYTTVAESRFANAIANAMISHLNAVTTLKSEFIQACREVDTRE
jgi:hypothetical protein